MIARTDLACESLDNISVNNGESELQGIIKKERTENDCTITDISVTTKEASEKIGKPEGRYITVTIPSLIKNPIAEDSKVETIAKEIASFLDGNGTVLVAGLGNSDITPDALGSAVAKKIFATRHIPKSVAEETGLSGIRPVCSIAVGVLGQTGIESEETVNEIARSVEAETVIIIDALAAGNTERLGTTVQITNTGITPGSGVKNKRREISSASLGGINVISIGVPTVVDAVTIASQSGGDTTKMESLVVTPKDIDVMIERISKVVSKAINRALFPSISSQDLDYLVL